MRKRPVVSKVVFAAIVLTCASSVNAQDAPESREPITAEQMREDLVYLRDTWAPMDKSFSADERRAFESIIDTTMVNAETLTPAKFAMEVARAVAVSGNGHTNARPYRYLRFMPIRVWWFSDGLYIVETHPEYAVLLGARVEKIGNLTAEEALARIAPYISGTEEHVRVTSVPSLISPEALHHAGVTNNVAEAALTLRLPDSEIRVVTLRPQPSRNPLPRGLGVIPMTSDMSIPDRWPHVLDAVPERSPAFRSPFVDISHAWLRDDTVLYLRSDRLFGDDDVSIRDKLILEILHTIVLPQRPRYVIVDLRLNTGGNLYNTVLFSQMLPKLIPDDGQIFVLVGNVTFSAAIVTAAMLKKNGGEKVTLIGERMGDGARFWAEGLRVPLPNSRIGVAFAGEFHDWSNGCSGRDDCFLAAAIYAGGGISLEPEIEVSTTFKDYAAGRDAVLDTALSLTE